MKPTMSRNGVPSGTASTGNERSRASSSSARRDALEDEVDADPERGSSRPRRARSTSAFWAATLPFSRIPAVSMIQWRSRNRRRLLDVDAVRARDLAVERGGAAAQQREPEVLLGDEVTEDQRRRGGLHARGV